MSIDTVFFWFDRVGFWSVFLFLCYFLLYRAGLELAKVTAKLEQLTKAMEVRRVEESEKLESEKTDLSMRIFELENDKSELETEQDRRKSEVQGMLGKLRGLEKQLNPNMIAARDLRIVWAEPETPEYWKWLFSQESRFGEVAELVNVNWLEIYGRLDTSNLTAKTTYAAYLVYKMTDESEGFDVLPAEAFVGIVGGVRSTKNIFLVKKESETSPTERPDGWMEVELGEYFVLGDEDGDMEMSLKETDDDNAKSGLVVDGIEVRPKCMSASS